MSKRLTVEQILKVVRIAAALRMNDKLTPYAEVTNTFNAVTKVNTVKQPEEMFTLSMTSWVLEYDEDLADFYVPSQDTVTYRKIAVSLGLVTKELSTSLRDSLKMSTTGDNLKVESIDMPTYYLTKDEYNAIQNNPEMKVDVMAYNFGRMSQEKLYDKYFR